MITIEAIAPPSNEDSITRIAKQSEATDYWVSSSSEKQIAIKILIENLLRQQTKESSVAIQNILRFYEYTVYSICFQ